MRSSASSRQTAAAMTRGGRRPPASPSERVCAERRRARERRARAAFRHRGGRCHGGTVGGDRRRRRCRRDAVATRELSAATTALTEAAGRQVSSSAPAVTSGTRSSNCSGRTRTDRASSSSGPAWSVHQPSIPTTSSPVRRSPPTGPPPRRGRRPAHRPAAVAERQLRPRLPRRPRQKASHGRRQPKDDRRRRPVPRRRRPRSRRPGPRRRPVAKRTADARAARAEATRGRQLEAEHNRARTALRSAEREASPHATCWMQRCGAQVKAERRLAEAQASLDAAKAALQALDERWRSEIARPIHNSGPASSPQGVCSLGCGIRNPARDPVVPTSSPKRLCTRLRYPQPGTQSRRSDLLPLRRLCTRLRSARNPARNPFGLTTGDTRVHVRHAESHLVRIHLVRTRERAGRPLLRHGVEGRSLPRVRRGQRTTNPPRAGRREARTKKSTTTTS